MLVWVGQTEKWRVELVDEINSLFDMIREGYDLVRIEFEGSDDEEAEFLLEQVFEKCNIGNEVRKLKHSLSVGDVVVLYRNKKYEVFVCEKVGWKKIAETKIFP